MKRTAAVLLFTVFAASASAKEVSVLTGQTCDLYLLSKDSKNPIVKLIVDDFRHYIYGYLSARAVYTGEDNLKGVDARLLHKEIDEQCNVRPQAKIVDIAEIIAEKLGHR